MRGNSINKPSAASLPVDGSTLAIVALGYLAADPDRLGDFLAATGLTVATVRSSAGDAAFARGVLAHVLAHEDILVGLARERDLDPAALARHIARFADPGRGAAD